MFDFLTQKFSSVFSSLTQQKKLTSDNIEQALSQIKEALLDADVPLDTLQIFMQEVTSEVLGKNILKGLRPSEHFIKLVHDKMVLFLGGKTEQETFTFVVPSVICVMGLQGSGKTTTVAKLAHLINKQAATRGKKRKILCASVDFYRPAALDQLAQLAKSELMDFYRSPYSSPQQAALDIIKHFKTQGYDHLLFDTAGRLHVDDQMMQELEEVKKIIQPKYSFLVLDSMIGQQSLQVAKIFSDKIGFDGAILTKIDSDTRGGVAFAFKYELKKPIFFMGVGEKVDQLEMFRPERIVNRIMGMGDLQTLLETAEEKITLAEQDRMNRSIGSDRFTLDDFAYQLSIMSRLGSFSSIMKLLPGAGQLKISAADMERSEKELKKFKAILSSMTQKERLRPDLLDGSRKKRIAQGAGVEVATVNVLLQRFEESKQFAKLLKGNRFFK